MKRELSTLVAALIFVWAALTLAAGPPEGSGPPPAEPPKETTIKMDVGSLVDKVQASYEKTTGFKARFNQTYTHIILGRPQRSSGVVMIKKPGRMRWDYEKPTKKHFIADGKTLWIYEPEERQLIKQPFDGAELSSSIAFLWGKGNLKEDFNVALAADPNLAKAPDLALDLIPKQQDGRYQKLIFVVDGKTFQVKETYVYDSSGNVNHMVFSKIEINKEIPDKVFQFVPPPGLEPIDMTAPAKGGRP